MASALDTNMATVPLQNEWRFRPHFCTCKAILGRGQNGLMTWIMFVMNHAPWCSIDRSTCWPAAQQATTVLRMPLSPPSPPRFCSNMAPACFLITFPLQLSLSFSTFYFFVHEPKLWDIPEWTYASLVTYTNTYLYHSSTWRRKQRVGKQKTNNQGEQKLYYSRRNRLTLWLMIVMMYYCFICQPLCAQTVINHFVLQQSYAATSLCSKRFKLFYSAWFSNINPFINFLNHFINRTLFLQLLYKHANFTPTILYVNNFSSTIYKRHV